ncbi:MAG: DUF559 domain-containing protein, partial [Arenimonas sp.]|nr:DUF559 domain-containing protein [Arenimonas sp.]
KERARLLRKAGNPAEIRLWLALKGGRLGLDFDRQRIIGNYIVDFYCHRATLVIEIDGASHDDRGDYDAVRDHYLAALGLQVVRIKHHRVLSELTAVVDEIRCITEQGPR